ncbi:hypothetical protein BH24GEM3_BH24GEM3_14290 [soil metagenome]|jgi:hypothetical protein
MPADDRPITTPVRLLFADQGTFHSETVQVPLDKLAQHERLLDLLREEPSVTRQMYLDLKRLVAAWVGEAESE